jgi:hypothetical protein
MYTALVLTVWVPVLLVGWVVGRWRVPARRGRVPRRQRGARWASLWQLRHLVVVGPRPGRIILGRRNRLTDRLAGRVLLAVEQCHAAAGRQAAGVRAARRGGDRPDHGRGGPLGRRAGLRRGRPVPDGAGRRPGPGRLGSWPTATANAPPRSSTATAPSCCSPARPTRPPSSLPPSWSATRRSLTPARRSAGTAASRGPTRSATGGWCRRRRCGSSSRSGRCWCTGTCRRCGSACGPGSAPRGWPAWPAPLPRCPPGGWPPAAPPERARRAGSAGTHAGGRWG